MSSSHPFHIVNVFTHEGRALSGNPLCVFEDGSAFDTATMQALALQMNLSETTFILPSTRADAAVRIFTPNYEMPFAGHPTLGTAHVCRALGRGGDALVLDMPAGLIEVSARADAWTLTAPPARVREVSSTRAELAAALGLGAHDVAERPLWVSAGKEQLVVPLVSADAVRRAAPQAAGLAHLRTADGDAMAYVFARTGPGTAVARFFFSQGVAMLEDPATGSATANAGGWLIAMGEPRPAHLRIEQGAQIGRPSTLDLDVDAAGRIRVSGVVRTIARGVLTL